jgi:hypothetical protein
MQRPVTFVTLITHRKRILIFSSLCGGTDGEGNIVTFPDYATAGGRGEGYSGRCGIAAGGWAHNRSQYIYYPAFCILKVVAAFLNANILQPKLFLYILYMCAGSIVYAA